MCVSGLSPTHTTPPLFTFPTCPQVRELLQAFGALKSFHLVTDRDTGTNKGFGFCEYSDPALTDAAVAGLSAIIIAGVCGKVWGR